MRPFLRPALQIVITYDIDNILELGEARYPAPAINFCKVNMQSSNLVQENTYTFSAGDGYQLKYQSLWETKKRCFFVLNFLTSSELTEGIHVVGKMTQYPQYTVAISVMNSSSIDAWIDNAGSVVFRSNDSTIPAGTELALSGFFEFVK